MPLNRVLIYKWSLYSRVRSGELYYFGKSITREGAKMQLESSIVEEVARPDPDLLSQIRRCLAPRDGAGRP